jgi:hypothetical protein
MPTFLPHFRSAKGEMGEARRGRFAAGRTQRHPLTATLFDEDRAQNWIFQDTNLSKSGEKLGFKLDFGFNQRGRFERPKIQTEFARQLPVRNHTVGCFNQSSFSFPKVVVSSISKDKSFQA